jgi:hypothetical protein
MRREAEQSQGQGASRRGAPQDGHRQLGPRDRRHIQGNPLPTTHARGPLPGLPQGYRIIAKGEERRRRYALTAHCATSVTSAENCAHPCNNTSTRTHVTNPGDTSSPWPQSRTKPPQSHQECQPTKPSFKIFLSTASPSIKSLKDITNQDNTSIASSIPINPE